MQASSSVQLSDARIKKYVTAKMNNSLPSRNKRNSIQSRK